MDELPPWVLPSRWTISDVSGRRRIRGSLVSEVWSWAEARWAEWLDELLLRDMLSWYELLLRDMLFWYELLLRDMLFWYELLLWDMLSWCELLLRDTLFWYDWLPPDMLVWYELPLRDMVVGPKGKGILGA